MLERSTAYSVKHAENNGRIISKRESVMNHFLIASIKYESFGNYCGKYCGKNQD